MPVAVLLIAGGATAGATFLRSLQAGDLCQLAVRMAGDGADFEQSAVQEQLFAAPGGGVLRERRALLRLTHVGGAIKTFEIGEPRRFPQASGKAEDAIRLEAGEDAWVAELWMENPAIVSVLAPEAVYVRLVR